MKSKEKRYGLMLLIKPGNDANYRTIVDLLDEATINIVKKYAVINPSKQEVDWLRGNNH